MSQGEGEPTIGIDDHQSEDHRLIELQNKYKTKSIQVKAASDVDITSVALQRYEDLKKDYNFVSFEESDKRKKHFSGYLEPYAMSNYDFNKEYVSFHSEGYSNNPNQTFKGLVFNDKIHPELARMTESLGEQIGDDHPDFILKMHESTSKKRKLEKTKEIKAKRQKSEGTMFANPWAGYGEDLTNGQLTQ